MKTAKGGLLVREIREHSVEIRHPQDFTRARAEIEGPQLGAVFSRGEKTAHQLADSRAVEVGDIVKIQEHASAPFLEEILQQVVDGLPFDQREASSYIHNRNFTQLPSAGTKTQTDLPGTGAQPFYRMPGGIRKC